MGGYFVQVGIRDDLLYRQQSYGTIADGLAAFGYTCGPGCAPGVVD